MFELEKKTTDIIYGLIKEKIDDQSVRDQLAQSLFKSYQKHENDSLKQGQALRIINNVASDEQVYDFLSQALEAEDTMQAILILCMRPRAVPKEEFAGTLITIWKFAAKSGSWVQLHWALPLIPEDMREKVMEPIPLLWWMKGHKSDAVTIAQWEEVPEHAALAVADFAAAEHPQWAQMLREKRAA